MNENLLSDWSDDDFKILEDGILCAKHRMADTGLFTDEGLIKILDAHPEEAMSINLMGTDTNKFEWREGERNGCSSEDLINLVRQGHFWLNLRSVQRHHPELSKMINGVYDELEASSPGFIATARTGNLLISSPQAIVYYHIDTKVNMLWHMRGRKRVWVYPPHDERFVSNKVIELCASGAFTDEVPYDKDFD